MRLRKRFAWGMASATILLMLAAASYWVSGSSAVESWVGSQLLQRAATYLEPELRFERLTYQRPRIILLDNVTLSSPDPANAGGSVVIFAVKHARLELTEIPHRGKPVRFSKVFLDSPEFRGVAATPGKAKLVGFSNLMKRDTHAEESVNSDSLTLSDFLHIRHIEITHGSASFDSRIPNSVPVRLDGIFTQLDFAPADETSHPGRYHFATTILRKPAVALDLRGSLDINTLILELAKLELSLDVQEKNVHFLPSELQGLLKTFDVAGELGISASGSLPLSDVRQSTVKANGTLMAATIAVGENRLAIDSLLWDVDLAAGVATIRKGHAQLLGGEVQLAGTIPLDSSQPARLELRAEGLQIQQMLRSLEPGVVPEYAGNVAAAVTFAAPMDTWNQGAAGGGTFSVRQGRIDKLPVLGRILTELNNAVTKSVSGRPETMTDSADGSFSFQRGGVSIGQFTGRAGALAFRATGTVGFDRQLNLRLNAGPIERLQSSLGVVGQAWGSVSDAMSGYRVSGPLEDPKVSLEIGGGR